MLKVRTCVCQVCGGEFLYRPRNNDKVRKTCGDGCLAKLVSGIQRTAPHTGRPDPRVVDRIMALLTEDTWR